MPLTDAVEPTVAVVTVLAVIVAFAAPPVTEPSPVARTLSVDLAVLVAFASTVMLRPDVADPSQRAVVGDEMSAAGALTATPRRMPPVITLDFAVAKLWLIAVMLMSAVEPAAMEPPPEAIVAPVILASLEPIAREGGAIEPVWMSDSAVLWASASTVTPPAWVTAPSRVAV